MQLHNRLPHELSIDHVTVHLREFLYSLDDDVCAFDSQRKHFDERVHPLLEVEVVVEYALHFDALGDHNLEVLYSRFAAPVVVSRSSPAQNDFGVVGHQPEHRAQHIFPHIVVVDVNQLPAHNLLQLSLQTGDLQCSI